MSTFKFSLTTLSIALFSLLATGCNDEESNSNNGNTITTYKITAKCAKAIAFDPADSDQTFLANGWPENAEISILKSSGSAYGLCVANLSTSGGTETVTFSGRIESGIEIGEYYLAIYPSIAVGENYIYDTSATGFTLSSEKTNLEAIEEITKFYPVPFHFKTDGTSHTTLEFEHQYTFFTFYMSVPELKYQDSYEKADKISLYTYDENGEQLRASVGYFNNSDDPDSTLLGFAENPKTDYSSSTWSNKIFLAVPDQIGEQALKWVIEDTQGGTNSEALYYQDDYETSYAMNAWTYKYIQGNNWSTLSDDDDE